MNGGESKQLQLQLQHRVDYKGSKYHVSFKDEVMPMQQLVTYVDVQCYKEDYDVDSDNSDIDFSNSNNNSNNITAMHNNKYFINYKNCCCNIT